MRLDFLVPPSDIHPVVFGYQILDMLRRHCFGIFGKPQLDAPFYHAFKGVSSDVRGGVVFARAELLRIAN
jgi:hypothetical protein